MQTKFVLAQATAHNVYLLLYPTGPLKAALERAPGLYQKVFEGCREWIRMQ